ncbi:MAG TPA: universal stress protein [Alphaproteobacteria bacterium]|nr:universal stress protein [Alphaproteobacteria bacterium]
MKILLAIDGSKCSEAAVDALLSQYRAEGADVLILNVVESVKLMPATYGFGMGPVFADQYATIAQQWRSEGEALVSRMAQRLQTAGFKTSTSVQEGDARDLILECAEKWSPDLILLGSHGWKGLDRWLLGSVSEAIARHAKCSVEIVRTRAAA